MEAWGGCVQTRHGLRAVQSKTGLVLSVMTGLTGLDLLRLYTATKCGQMCQGENHRDKLALSEQACCGQREYLPLLFLPCWQAIILAVPQTGETNLISSL